MRGRWGRRSTAGGLCAAVLLSTGGVAAEDAFTIGGRFNSSLEIDDNPALSAVSRGTETRSLSTIGLDFGYATPTSDLVLSFDTRLDARRKANDDTSLTLDRPTVSLTYTLLGPDSRLAVRRRTRTFTVANALYLDTDGDFVPELIASSIGDVTTSSSSVALSFGIDAPFGIDLSLSRSATDYQGTVDPDLFDVRRDSARIGSHLRLSEVATLRPFVSRTEKHEDDTPAIVTTYDSYGTGLDYDIAPDLRFSGEVAQTSVETVIDDGADTRGPSRSGVTLDATLTRDLPNGTISISTGRRIDEDEVRNSVRVDRAMAIPGASLAFGLGLSQGSGQNPVVIGSMTYLRELPLATLSATAARTAGTGTSGNQVTTTVIAVDYLRSLTPATDLNLGLDLARSATESEDASGEAILSVGFDRALTEDWSWTVGYEARFRNEGSGLRSSNTLLTSIGRRFSIRP